MLFKESMERGGTYIYVCRNDGRQL